MGEALYLVYEVGSSGFSLLRRSCNTVCTCELVAPTSVPKRPDDRVKNDRRDTRKLTRLRELCYLDHLFVPVVYQEVI